MAFDWFLKKCNLIFTLQVDRCSADDPPLPATDPPPTAAETSSPALDATKTATDPMATDTTAADKPSMFNQCKTLVYKTISDLGVGTGMVLKAIGHAALAVMSALFGTYNGVVLTTAVAGETVAAGINSVNNVADRVVLVGDITSGAANLATGLTTTFRKNLEFNNENRQMMVEELESRLDNYQPKAFLVPPVANEVGSEVTAAKEIVDAPAA